jgi:hypothetical protein
MHSKFVTNDEPSLYRQVLGDAYGLLPAALQHFHEQPWGGRRSGDFEVRRGNGRLRNWLASLLGLPRAASSVPVTLQVVVEGDRERWIRTFGALRMETMQLNQNGLLVEAAGPMRFGFHLAADSTGLEYRTCRAWFWLFRLPRMLIPNRTARNATVAIAMFEVGPHCLDSSRARRLLGLDGIVRCRSN